MMSIKEAGLQDLPVIQRLAHQIWPTAYADILSPNQLAYMLDKIYSLPCLQHQLIILKHQFILVFDDDEPVAFVSYSFDESNKATYHLQKIYLLPQLQGKGTGKFILNHIINSIRSSGGTSLELNVNRHNKARYFYEKLGFLVISETDIEIGHGYYMNDYIMKLEL